MIAMLYYYYVREKTFRVKRNDGLNERSEQGEESIRLGPEVGRAAPVLLFKWLAGWSGNC